MLDAPSAPNLKGTIALSGIAYHFDELVPIDAIASLADNPDLLTKFKERGHARFAHSRIGIAQQAVMSARKTLSSTGLTTNDLDGVLIGTSELRDWAQFPEMFAAEILLGLGACNLPVFGMTLGGCANYASSLRMARNMVVAEGMRKILVVESNQVRGELDRVCTSSFSGAPGHILGDGAVSFIVAPDTGDFTVLGMEQVMRPVDETSADATTYATNNVAGFRHVLDRALQQAGVTRDDIDKVFFHNINARLLRGLMDVTDFRLNKLFMDNIGRTAHLWGADNLIGVHDYCTRDNPPAGTLFALLCQANTYFSAVVLQKR